MWFILNCDATKPKTDFIYCLFVQLFLENVLEKQNTTKTKNQFGGNFGDVNCGLKKDLRLVVLYFLKLKVNKICKSIMSLLYYTSLSW